MLTHKTCSVQKKYESLRAKAALLRTENQVTSASKVEVHISEMEAAKMKKTAPCRKNVAKRWRLYCVLVADGLSLGNGLKPRRR